MQNQEHIIKVDDDIVIDFMHPEDAPGVTKLFREVYGEEYPVKAYYNPDALIEANNNLSIISSVARTNKGEIVGNTALFYSSSPNKKIYESGSSIVLPAFRNKNINNLLIKHCLEVAATFHNVEKVYGECVCNHVFMQKASVKIGAKFTALEVDLMPESAYKQENSAKGRVSAIVSFVFYSDLPHLVYIPQCYYPQSKLIYENMGVERQILKSDEKLPCDKKTDIDIAVNEQAQVAFLLINEIGSDFYDKIDEIENRKDTQNVLVYNLRIPLNSHASGAAIEILRSKKYFFGGILPRWFQYDGILMQKLKKEPDWSEIKLINNWCEQILNMVKEDWGHTTS